MPDDGHADAGQLAALAEVVEIAVVEEELRTNVIRAGVHFPLEVVHLLEAIGRRGMAFREAGDADAEAARTWRGRARADEAHQILGVAEGVGTAVIVQPIARRIAAQRQDVLDA